MHYNLLVHEGGVETQTCKTRVMTTLRGLADISVPANHYCIRSFSRLKASGTNNVIEKYNNDMQKVIKHVFRSKTCVIKTTLLYALLLMT